MRKKRNRTTAVNEGANGEVIYVNGPRDGAGSKLTSNERSAKIRDLEASLDDLDATAGQRPVTTQKHEIGAGTITVNMGTLAQHEESKALQAQAGGCNGACAAEVQRQGVAGCDPGVSGDCRGS